MNGQAVQATVTAFLVLFNIVGLALWGLPYYYDFMVQQFGWTHAQVTSGHALSKLVVVAGAIPFLAASCLPLLLYVFAILFAVGLGGGYMIISLLSAKPFDMQFLGRLLGVILTADGVAEAVAPWIVDHIRDRTGRYLKAFLFLIGIALLGSAAVSLLPRRAVRA